MKMEKERMEGRREGGNKTEGRRRVKSEGREDGRRKEGGWQSQTHVQGRQTCLHYKFPNKTSTYHGC